MGRIQQTDWLPIVDAHVGHYGEAETINGSAILLVLGYGRPQLQAQRTELHTLLDELTLIFESDLPTLRAERTAIWGISPQDDNGVWFRLTLYKAMVRARLGARHPLTRTVPNLGQPTFEPMLSIIHQFINHWARVNAALPSPLLLGTYSIANLQTAHDNLDAKMKEIEAALSTLALKREQALQLFGDEPEELRELTSIIARLLLYHATIGAMFPNQPIADSLPQIFPVGPETPLPTFAYNWVLQPGSIVKLWLNPPSPALADAALVFLKEGVVELTLPVTTTTPGDIDVYNFSGVTVIGEIDELDLRNGDGITIARGVRDTSLPEPT